MSKFSFFFQAAAIISICGSTTAFDPSQMHVSGIHSHTPPANNVIFPSNVLNLTRSEPNEYRLRNDLLKLQNPMSRPVKSPFDVVNIKFGVKLSTLVEVRNKEQLMTTDMWVEQVWQNPFLSWNKNDYGGLERIYVKAEEIWVPDTVLLNNGNDRVLMAGYTNLFKTFVILYSNGTNRWMSPATFISTCSINVKTFPFDEQACDLEFGSWTMDAKDFIITPLYKHDNKALTESGDWKIESFDVKKKEVLHDCCSSPFSVVVYTLKIRRKPVFYGLFLILPCLIIGGLILATFFLPPENGERLGLCSTILLAVSVYLLIVAELLPEKSDTLPLIGVYFIITMLEISFVLVATIFVLRAYHATGDPPRCLEIFALRFKEVKLKKLREKTKFHFHFNGAFTNKTWDVENPDDNKNMRDTTTAAELQGKDFPTTTELQLQENISPTTIEMQENDIPITTGLPGRSSVDLIAQSLEDEKKENERRDSWRDIAVAFDRLFFWVFAITFALSTFIVYSQT